jgi:isopentenyl diphosphate isomerase/L-lactate dehydrogenase-like FMN-dependent dehydrogenase
VTGFSIPSAAIPATLLQTAGGKREGQIYEMERVPQHAGPETPLDMLNRAEGFFAFRPKGDGAGVQLVAKARTVSLTVPATQPEDTARLSAAKRAHLEITLADGSQVSGWATIELPQHHSRLLDYLNTSSEPFFAIADDDGVHLVNRAHVLYARPED